MTKDIVKKAKNGTYYFKANLGYHPSLASKFRSTAVVLRLKKQQGKNIRGYFLQSQTH